jgi:hypothetical protein
MNAPEEVRNLLAALQRIVNARNANPEPCHWKISAAIDAARDPMQQAQEELDAEED